MSELLRIRTLSIVVALAALLGACGDKDDPTPTLRIDGTDIDFDQDVYEAAPGPLTVDFRNRGSLAHNIVFRDVPDAPQAAGEDDLLAAGQDATYDLDVVTGEFAFYCSVPGHEEAGMVGTLIVG